MQRLLFLPDVFDCALHGEGECVDLIREGSSWIILLPRRQSHPVQTTKKPSPEPRKRKNSSMQRHTIQCNATGARRTSFTDSSLIVWLLLFALNVLMFLVGVNGTPESDYLSAPLTNSTFILYFSFLITWVPTSLCINCDKEKMKPLRSLSQICQKCSGGFSLHFNHQRSCSRRKNICAILL